MAKAKQYRRKLDKKVENYQNIWQVKDLVSEPEVGNPRPDIDPWPSTFFSSSLLHFSSNDLSSLYFSEA